jgi:hypothetical protein
MLFMVTCNENRCDLYCHIINLIYNNVAKPRDIHKFSFLPLRCWTKDQLILLSFVEVSSREKPVTNRNVVFSLISLKHHFSWGGEEQEEIKIYFTIPFFIKAERKMFYNLEDLLLQIIAIVKL